MDTYTEDQIDLAARMEALLVAHRGLAESIDHLVEDMRTAEMSWAKIGLAAGMSPQAAWERWSGRERDSEVPSSWITFQGM